MTEGRNSSIARFVHALRLAGRILGGEAAMLIIVSVPIGMISGLVEIVFALKLQHLLVRFDLLPAGNATQMPMQVPVLINSLADILIVAVVLVFFRFLSLALPPIAGELFLGRVRRQLVDYVTFTDYAQVDMSSMEASHLLSNIAPRSQGFFSSLSQFLTAMVIVAVLFAGMLEISIKLTAITVLVGFVVMAPLTRMRKIFTRLSLRSYALMHGLTRRLLGDIRNLHLVKLMGADQFEHDQLFRMNGEFIRVQRSYYLTTNIAATVPMLLGVWIVVGVTWLNDSWSLIAPAAMVPFIYLLYRMSSTISQGLSYGGAMMYSFPFFDSLAQVWERKLGVESRHHQVTHDRAASLTSLETRDLAVGRDTVFFSDLNFSLKAGDTLLIRGESGRGKTTLLLTLVGMLPPKAGKIQWCGADIAELDTNLLRRTVGYAGADPFLLDVTIRENLLFGSQGRTVGDADLDMALWCAAGEFVQALPIGKDTLLKEDGDGVSAGQKQRIALARALILNPNVLFLDEAMANIDEATEAIIMTRLRERYPNLIIISVSHRSSMRQWATQVVDL